MAHILLPTDFSTNALNAARYAINLFGTEGNTFTVLHSYMMPRSSASTMWSMDDVLARESHEAMELFLARMQEEFGSLKPTLSGACEHGDLPNVIQRFAKDAVPPDVVVMGTQGASGTLISPALPSLTLTKQNAHLPVIAVPGVGERLVPKFLETSDPATRVRGTIDVTFADPSRVAPERLEEAAVETEVHDRLPYASEAFLRSLRGLLRTYADIGPQRPWKLAERVTCPTLVVYGRKDPLVDSRSAHRVTKHFRDAHVVVLPDSGHVAQMEHPEFVRAAWERFIG